MPASEQGCQSIITITDKMAGKRVKCNRMLPDGKSALWFSTALIEWYGINKRSLPWRDVSEPYLIWLSEVILQQTRVEQGMAYYRKMAERYPSVYDLAAAEEEDVLKMWQGLGYYSRARNMHATARYIAENLNGEFPRNYKELLKLKGVGVQTAAAIASFAFDLPHPVIDGNVIRVLSRYFGIERDASHAGGRMYFSDLAHSIMAKKQSATYNQAIMDFGAMLCVPGNPRCDVCPVAKRCVAYSTGMQKMLPLKSKKTTQKKRFFHYLIIGGGHGILFNKRKENDIWKGLYDFPLLEAERMLSEDTLLQHLKKHPILEKTPWELGKVSGTYTHILTHQRIEAKFIELDVAALGDIPEGFEMTAYKDIPALAVPRLVEKYLYDSHRLL